MPIAERQRMKALVLGAGRGERLRPLTDTVPKPLVHIGGRSLLSHWADALARVGVTEALINVHHLAAAMENGIAELNSQGPVRWSVAHEPQLLGTAGTVRANAAWLGDADICLIIYADNYSSASLGDFLETHFSGDAAMTLGLFRTPTPRECGIVDLDAKGVVTGFEEKPRYPKSDVAFAGLIAMSADAYKEVAQCEGEDLGHHVLPGWVGRARGWIVHGHHIDIGTPAGLAEAREMAEQRKSHDEREASCGSC